MVSKISALKAKSSVELIEELKSFQREKMNLRFQKAAKEEVSNVRIKIVRRSIARIKTVLNQIKRENASA